MICALCGKQAPDQGGAACPSCGKDAILQGLYRLDAIVGRGASGVTYRATQLSGQRTVAVKELSFRSLDSFKLLELFQREAKVLKQLRHPGIPAYLADFYVEEGRHLSFYLVQEFIAGQTLAREAESKRYTERELLHLACEVLEILAYLHQLSPAVIHRDLKPQNIMRREANGRLVLLDFGAVKDSLKESTQGGSTVAGTFGYMAPEQFQGQAFPASDLYSLGAVLVSLLCGVSAEKLLNNQNQLSWQHRAQVRPEVSALLHRMLAPEVSHRPASAAALRQEISQLLANWDQKPAPPVARSSGGMIWLPLGMTLLMGVGAAVYHASPQLQTSLSAGVGLLDKTPQPQVVLGGDLGWFDQYARPIIVDTNGDGFEDIIALYIKKDLKGYVGVFDGKTFQERWSVGPFGERNIATGKLFAAVAGKRLAVADFQGALTFYELSSGAKVHDLQQDEVASDLCGGPPGERAVWLEPPGVMVDSETFTTTKGAEPKWCGGDADRYDSRFKNWYSYRQDNAPPKLPRYEVIQVLQGGSPSFAIGKEKTGYQRYFLLEYDPKSLEVSSQRPLQDWIGDKGEPLVERLSDELREGLFVLDEGLFIFMYKGKESSTVEAWNHIVGVDLKTSKVLYDTTIRFSSHAAQQSVVTKDRLYLLDMSWDFPRLHILDRRSGAYLARFGFYER